MDERLAQVAEPETRRALESYRERIAAEGAPTLALASTGALSGPAQIRDYAAPEITLRAPDLALDELAGADEQTGGASIAFTDDFEEPFPADLPPEVRKLHDEYIETIENEIRELQSDFFCVNEWRVVMRAAR